MVQIILSDENCEGQADAIFQILKRLGFVEMLELELKTLPAVGLRKGVDDLVEIILDMEERYRGVTRLYLT
jgi:hypothetical protein